LSNHNGFKLQGRKGTGKGKKKRVPSHTEMKMEKNRGVRKGSGSKGGEGRRVE